MKKTIIFIFLIISCMSLQARKILFFNQTGVMLRFSCDGGHNYIDNRGGVGSCDDNSSIGSVYTALIPELGDQKKQISFPLLRDKNGVIIDKHHVCTADDRANGRTTLLYNFYVQRSKADSIFARCTGQDMPYYGMDNKKPILIFYLSTDSKVQQMVDKVNGSKVYCAQIFCVKA